MAERERVRIDVRALRIGATTGLVAGGAVYGVLRALAFLINPAVRDLPGGLPTLSGTFIGVVAAGVGGAVGWARLRATRRVVASGLSQSDGAPGARALAIARRDRGLTDGDQRPARGLADAAAVQRWSPDLLLCGDVRPVAEGVNDDDW